MNIKEKISVIEKYAELINDELGEYWMSLTSLNSSADFFPEEFAKVYESTIDEVYAYIMEFGKIKVTEQTYTQKFREVVFLDTYDVEDDDKFEE